MTDYNVKRQKQREETEQRIIETAIRLFGENGYAKTSIKEIAEGAEVANGLVGKYFATKEILLYEAYRHATTYSYPISGENLSANESTKLLVTHTLEIYENKPEYFLFFKTLMNASDLPDEYMMARREFFKNASIYPNIIKEQEKGNILNVNPHDFFIIFMKMVFNIVEIYNLMPHSGEINVARNTIKLVIDTMDKYLTQPDK